MFERERRWPFPGPPFPFGWRVIHVIHRTYTAALPRPFLQAALEGPGRPWKALEGLSTGRLVWPQAAAGRASVHTLPRGECGAQGGWPALASGG